MPTGIYKRTKEHGEIISKALKVIKHRPPIFSGSEASNWKGGRIRRSEYIYIHKPGHPHSGKQGYVAEHRLVMESHIGRYLLPRETIHHINKIHDDNRLENLVLCESRGLHTKQFHPEVAARNKILNKGIRRSVKTEFKKGMIPWNKK